MHIYEKSHEMMRCSEYEDNWYFYHDALSQMTDKTVIKLMEEEGILKHWIFSEQKLLKGTYWELKTLSNSPDFNPLDCNLNRDFHSRSRLEILIIMSNYKGIDVPNVEKLSSTKQKYLETVYKTV